MAEQPMHPYVIRGYGCEDADRVFTDQGGVLTRFSHKHQGKDLATVRVTPSWRGKVDVRIVDSWDSMLKLPNQRWAPIWLVGMEVGHAYNAAVQLILSSEELSTFKYMLTVEEDNAPPPLGYVRLVEAAVEHDFDVLSGLYYVKGNAGMTQIWGDPDDPHEQYPSQSPRSDTEYQGDDLIVRCKGTGMGFTLWNLDVFRKVEPPWFETVSDARGVWTQDLWFFHQAHTQGVPLKVGVHCGIRVGHLDKTGIMW